MKAPVSWSFALALGLAGCSASVGGSGGGGIGEPSTPASPGTPSGGAGGSVPGAGGSSPSSASRLSADEYAAAVTALFGVSSVQAPGPVAASPQPIDDATALAYHGAAVEVARSATSPGNLQALLGRVNAGCTVPAGDDGAAGASCAMAFIQQLTPRAFRSVAVDPSTTSALVDVYATVSSTQAFSAGIAAVVEEVLQSPYFLYHLPTQ